MLVIRDAQMEALRAGRRQRFEDAVVAHVRRRSGGEGIDARDVARTGIREALEMGLRGEQEIIRWIDLTARLKGHPDREPWARTILSDSELTPSLKLRLLEEGAGLAVTP